MWTKFLQRQFRLMEAADDKGSGGGGDDKPLTRAEITEMINKTVTGAVTTHTKRLEAKIPTVESLREGLGIGSLVEKLDALAAAPKSGDDKGKPKDNKGGDDLPEAIKQTMAKIQDDNAKLRKQVEDERKAREEQENKQRRTEERTALAEALRKGGVPEHHVKTLVPYLHTEVGAIKRADDGSIVYPVKRNGYDENLPLAEGVAEFLKSDEGKAYLPPVDAKGSGASGGSSGGAGALPAGVDPKNMTMGQAAGILFAGMPPQS